MTGRKFNIDDIKRTTNLISEIRCGKKKNIAFSTALPKMIGLKLTNSCNLRCRHCYEWSQTGFHHLLGSDAQKDEISYECIKSVLSQTFHCKSSLYLWGGEPLLYSHLDELADYLSKDKRKITLCTNGILASEKLHQIEMMSQDMDVIFSIDGFEKENDLIRGKGVFKQTLNGINALIESRDKGFFGGNIVVHLVINDSMVPRLYDFAMFLQNIGVDSVIFCYPWYISNDIAENMDRYCINHGFIKNTSNKDSLSWHHFKYNISEEMLENLFEQTNTILAHRWDMRLRFFPGIKERKEVKDFVTSRDLPENMKYKQCMALSSRMDILPGDYVTSCKHFPEFVLGKYRGSVREIWKSEVYDTIRRKINSKLMPVCLKCNLLYLYDY